MALTHNNISFSTMTRYTLLLALLTAPAVSGFLVSRTIQTAPQRSFVPLFMSDEPSDTNTDESDYFDDSSGGSDTVVTVEAEEVTPTAGEAMVSAVMDLIPSAVGSEISSEERTAVNEALYKLEALNPTSEPTVSPLLNGVWELRYVGGYSPDWALPSPTRQLALFLYSGGYSPGVFCLSLAKKVPAAVVDVGDLEIAISRAQPRVEASVGIKLLGGAESTVKVTARLEVESDLRLRETYESIKVMDRTTDLPKPLQYARDIFVTYVDEDLLIVRDGSGVPEVLVRKQKSFSKDWGTEPSSLEDMVAPGEE